VPLVATAGPRNVARVNGGGAVHSLVVLLRCTAAAAAAAAAPVVAAAAAATARRRSDVPATLEETTVVALSATLVPAIPALPATAVIVTVGAAMLRVAPPTVAATAAAAAAVASPCPLAPVRRRAGSYWLWRRGVAKANTRVVASEAKQPRSGWQTGKGASVCYNALVSLRPALRFSLAPASLASAHARGMTIGARRSSTLCAAARRGAAAHVLKVQCALTGRGCRLQNVPPYWTGCPGTGTPGQTCCPG